MNTHQKDSLPYQLEVADRLFKGRTFTQLIAKTALRVSHQVPGMRSLFCYDLVGGDQNGFLANIGAHVRTQSNGLLQIAGDVAGNQSNFFGIQSANNVGGAQSQGVGIQSVGHVKKAQAQGVGIQWSKSVGFDQMQGVGIQINTDRCDGQMQGLGIQSFRNSDGVNHHILGGITLAGEGYVEPGFVGPSITIQGGRVAST